MPLALCTLDSATGTAPGQTFKLILGCSSIKHRISSSSPEHCSNSALCHFVLIRIASTVMDPNLLRQIYSLEHGPTDGEVSNMDAARSMASLQTARSVIASVDRSPAIRSQLGSDRWLRLVNILQRLAYEDPDTGGEVDIALWCERQWATQLQNDADNESALQGKQTHHRLRRFA